ncbi:MAG: DNA methyltransferase [Dehalococcoidia bacterium]
MIETTSPMMSVRPELSRAATPALLRGEPRHGWFFFPHSFSPPLIEAVLDHWQADQGTVLDPFVGSGTTLTVALSRGLSCIGVDLSPLAVLISTVKTRSYQSDGLLAALERVTSHPVSSTVEAFQPERLQRAFTAAELRALAAIKAGFLNEKREVQDFFTVAWLRAAQTVSRAIPNGGWFRWIERRDQEARIPLLFRQFAQAMINDTGSDPATPGQPSAVVVQGDARHLPPQPQVNFVVTSPPYPNRHDYSRVFHIELLLLGVAEDAVTNFRHKSLRSHVEAHEPVGGHDYREPFRLTEILDEWPPKADRRIPKMLRGYFEDLHRTLCSLYPKVIDGGRLAFVLGNVRHAGVMIPVDELFAELAGFGGFSHEATWVLRERGNSAQQMGKYGRIGSRESVVLLTKAG